MDYLPARKVNGRGLTLEVPTNEHCADLPLYSW